MTDRDQDDRLSLTSEVPAAHWLHIIRNALAAHLGSENAADTWLDSRNMGYPTTARDAILEGKGALVMEDLEGQWGPSPGYS